MISNGWKIENSCDLGVRVQVGASLTAHGRGSLNRLAASKPCPPQGVKEDEIFQSMAFMRGLW